MRGFFRRKIPGKNYGFIEGEDQRDYFVYWNDFSRQSIPFRNARDAGDPSVVENADKVEFDGEETPKGPRARKVYVIRSEERVNEATQEDEGEKLTAKLSKEMTQCSVSENSLVESTRP